MSATPDRPGGPERLIFLHGFTQTHHHCHELAHLVAARSSGEPTTAFVDLPGHGLAVGDTEGEIGAVGERLARLTGPGTFVGYSMGGRIALAAALTRPDLVRRLVLIGVDPGIVDDAERAERRRLDDRRAERIEQIGVDAFLDEWLAAPLFASLPPDRRGLGHRRRNTAAGLAHSLRHYGTGTQEPVWDRLPGSTVPTLVIAGALDVKFRALGRRMADASPHATFVEIPSAGHAAHTEDPIAVADAIARWLRSTPTAT